MFNGIFLLLSSYIIYLADLLKIQVTSRAVRSSDAPHIVLPQTRTELAMRAFAVGAPVVWNSLPAHLRHCQTVLTFIRHTDSLF